MSSIDMLTVFFLVMGLIYLLLTTLYNPLILLGEHLVNTARVNVGPFINVLERDGDRLFLIEPEQVIIYNTAGVIYYYFEGGASRRLCPETERAIVRITQSDIRLINENGIYNISCTPILSHNLYSHFKNDSIEWQIPVLETSFTILDIINYLIINGLVKIK
ncbi:ODV-E28 [Diatraea saccharalis granulovirus]|uniref:ODV-E28 n=1 Tax=Diatraea saccharalis granulovirus TaxID=1675862 RepID=A0A0R7EYZ2_9BBAC|nr:ODV-E28 [Diatraea saccharalis granulovirus]AKN80806.1 ODV-E28 [Diatraea saccharalis granulovirus]